MMKKTLLTKTASIILALLMVVSTLVIVPFTASAAEADLTITTPQELQDFMTNISSTNNYAGKKVVLANDIDMKDYTFVPWQWKQGEDGAFCGTFDGQGHSIKNLSSSTNSFYLFRGLDNATVKNLRFVDSNVTLGRTDGVLAMWARNGARIENVYINVTVTTASNNTSYAGGMIGHAGGSFTVENCVVANTMQGTHSNVKVGGFLGQPPASGEVVTFKNCAFLGSIKGGNGLASFATLLASEVDRVAITDYCINMGDLDVTNWAAAWESGKGVKVVNSDNFSATLGELEEAGAAWTQTAENEMMPTSVATMLGITYVPEGPVADLIIKTPQQLQDFITNTSSTNNYAGKTIVLANDIDMKDYPFVPWQWTAGEDGAFCGTFDGQGHSIKNLSSSTGSCYLFRGLDNAVVQNLSIVESNVTLANNEGVLAVWARNNARIENVYINVAVTTSANYAGGMIGHAGGPFTVENCVVANTMQTTSSRTKMGGFVGQPPASGAVVTFKNCAFLGSIEGGDGWSSFVPLFNESVGRATIIDCINMSDLDVTNWAAAWESEYGVKVVNSDNFAATLEALGAAWTQTGKTEMMPTSVAEMIGKDYFATNLYYQRATALNADGTVDVRFITVIDTLDYDQVGFKLQITRTDANGVTTTSNVVTKATTQVFESINALGETVTAEELGGKYIVAVVITGINCADYENVISVTAFVQNGETQTPTATGTVTLATTAVAA